MIDLNVGINTVRENIGVNLLGLAFHHGFLDMTPKYKQQRKINKLIFIKSKIFGA